MGKLLIELFGKLTTKSENINYFIKNSFFVGISQLISVIVPVIIIPYIIRIIGIDSFGEYSIAFSLAMLSNIIVDFGFSLYGINIIAQNINNERENYYVTNIIILKSIIFIGVLIAVIFIILFVPYFQNLSKLYLLFLMVPISAIFNNSWYFQAKQKLFEYASINIISKTLYLMFVYLILKKTDDYIFLLPIFGFTVLLPNFYFTFIYKKLFHFKYFSFNEITFLFSNAKSYFLSGIYYYMMTSLNVPIVGYLLNNESAGIYSVIEKIYTGIKNIYNIYINVVLPRYTNHIHQGRKETNKIIGETYPLLIFVVILIIIFTQIFNTEIIRFFLHTESNMINHLFTISIIGLIVLMFNVPIYLYILAKNHNKILSQTSLVSSIITVISSFSLTYLFGLYGTASSIVIFELVMLTTLWYSYKKVKGVK